MLASYDEHSFVEKLENFFSSQKKIDDLKKQILHEKLQENKDAYQQSLAALALGTHSLTHDPKEALNFFQIAQNNNMLSIKTLALYYKIEALHRLKEYEKALDLLKLFYQTPASDNKSKKSKLQKQLSLIQLDLYFKLQKQPQFLQLYKELTKNYTRLSNLPETYHLAAAEILEKKKDSYQLFFLILEHLLINAPFTSAARWAFEKLTEYTCKSKEENYVFSLSALTNLSRNSVYDSGIKEFIRSQVHAKIRDGRGQLYVLTDWQKVTFFKKIRFFKEAWELAQEVWEKGNYSDKKQLLFVLGELANELGKHKEAVSYYALLQQEAEPFRKYQVKELIADSLRYGGFKASASGLYGYVASQTNEQLIRWYHFWTAYTSRDFNRALHLLSLQQNRYVPPRDIDYPEGPEYWKAKLLDQTNRREEALSLYKSLLSSSGDRLYADLAISKNPELFQNKKDEPLLNLHSMEKFKNLNSLDINPSSKLFTDKNSKIALINDLKNYGLMEAARSFLKDIDMSKISKEAMPPLITLATDLNDYKLSQQIMSNMGLNFENISLNWHSLTHNQSINSNLWKLYYPLVYNDFVQSVSNWLNIDKYLILSIMRAESVYDVSATSYVGARGLMQIMPYTAYKIAEVLEDFQFRLDKLDNPIVNIAYGSWYLRKLIDYYNGQVVVAVAAYNAGPNVVDDWIEECANCEIDEFIESIPYRETRSYVKKVFHNLARYRRIYKNDLSLKPLGKLPLTKQLFPFDIF